MGSSDFVSFVVSFKPVLRLGCSAVSLRWVPYTLSKHSICQSFSAIIEALEFFDNR